MAQLNTIADLKKDKIETFFGEREADIKAAQNYYNIRLNLPVLSRYQNNRTNHSYKKAKHYSDVFSEGDRFLMTGVAPVSDLRGDFAGEVALEFDMGPIFTFIQDATGLGTTGEALIARKEGNRTLFVSPLRHDPNAALKRTVDLGDKIAVPAIKAVQGENGSGITYDYHGQEVFAAWRSQPSRRHCDE